MVIHLILTVEVVEVELVQQVQQLQHRVLDQVVLELQIQLQEVV